jgi:hypothetical protein
MAVNDNLLPTYEMRKYRIVLPLFHFRRYTPLYKHKRRWNGNIKTDVGNTERKSAD